MNAPLIKLEKVGETVISQDGQYSEDTTIRVTAVNRDGETVTTFTGTVGIMELGTDIYGPNGGYLPSSVEITSGGTATFVARSLAGPFNDAAPPVDAMITSSNFAMFEGQSLAIPQWIVSGRKIDPRANENVYDWLQYRIRDIFAKYATASDVNTVLNAIRSFDMAYMDAGGRTLWERSATSPIVINPFFTWYRLDSTALGRCGETMTPTALTRTVLHEGRHAYQASLTVLPNNDVDGDFLPKSVGIPPTDITLDTTTTRTVCDQVADELNQKFYKGDISISLTFDEPDLPDFAAWAWEYDAWRFASNHAK